MPGTFPQHLPQRHRRWLWAARSLSATTRLPKPRVEGALAPSGGRVLIVVAALALAALVAGALYWATDRAGAPRAQEGSGRHAEAARPAGGLD